MEVNLENKDIKKRDAQLVKEILGGNDKAFATLINLYQKRVFALGMSFFKNETDTDDFIQEVFIKAYTNLSSFKGDSLFSTWLTRIAYNTAINSKARKKDFLPIANEELIIDKDSTPEEKEIRRITIEAVRTAIKELPEKYAICLELYFFYDTSYDEISIITDFPVNTIKSHIFRAKSILREKLEEHYAAN